MILTAWRIYKPIHAATAFTGEGARLFGGRLNSKGIAVVYTSSNISLASLEMLVHLSAADVLKAYVVRSVMFEHTMVTRLGAKDLPPNWRDSPPPMSMQQIGDEWVAAMTSAVLEVPSAVIETESNYLLNPAHPDFKHVKVGKEQHFSFDPRLLKI